MMLIIFLFTSCPLFVQKLLEEIEKNKDKVDECQKYAKAYIDAIKVCIYVCCRIHILLKYEGFMSSTLTECSHPGL